MFDSVGLIFILVSIYRLFNVEPVRLVFHGWKCGGNAWLESVSVNQVKSLESTNIEYLDHYTQRQKNSKRMQRKINLIYK